jgi:two-component system CheB/CheR fusion protein
MLIVFEEAPSTAPAVESAPTAQTESTRDQLVTQLQQELLATKEYQQSIIEALEASNEELQSANEEIQSGNENCRAPTRNCRRPKKSWSLPMKS